MYLYTPEMRKVFIGILAAAALSLFVSCGGGNAAATSDAKPVEMRYARLLSMSEPEPGVTLVTIRNPWDTLKTLVRYALVERGQDIKANLPHGTKKISVPIERSVVYSAVHVSLIDELGALNAINGVCDKEYVTAPRAVEGLTSGRIVDCGRNTAPVMERVVSLKPQAVVLSPYEKSSETALFGPTGITVIEAADYMEPTPLGRAEWMRFFGRLYGQSERADSLFGEVEREYLDIRDKVAKVAVKPSVLFDRLYNGIWNVPTSGSVTGILIEDAGGTNPFARQTKGGSAQLTAEEVLYTARNADIWLVRTFEPSGLTLKSLAADNPMYTRFEAYVNGHVYAANTVKTALFEDGAFHPQKTLREMVRILHPEIDSTPLQYYKPVK